MAMPTGAKNVALVPCPSALPTDPLPAKLVTSPLGVILRMRCSLVSETKILLLWSIAIAFRDVN